MSGEGCGGTREVPHVFNKKGARGGNTGFLRDREPKASGAHASTECRSVTCAVGFAMSSSSALIASRR